MSKNDEKRKKNLTVDSTKKMSIGEKNIKWQKNIWIITCKNTICNIQNRRISRDRQE